MKEIGELEEEIRELKAKSEKIKQRMTELRTLINEKKRKNLDASKEMEEWNSLFDEKMEIMGKLQKLKESLKNERLKEMVENFEESAARLDEIDEKIEKYTQEIRKLKEEREQLEHRLTEMMDEWQKGRKKTIKLKGNETTTILLDKAIKEFIKEQGEFVTAFVDKAIRYYLYYKYQIKIIDYGKDEQG